jgi:YafQ family addiction module toxin component
LRYSYEISRHLERDLEKIQKKDKERFEILLNKMSEILDNPHRFKPLRHDMKGLRRVHIDKSFVLVFEIVEPENKVIFWDFAHHDGVYRTS